MSKSINFSDGWIEGFRHVKEGDYLALKPSSVSSLYIGEVPHLVRREHLVKYLQVAYKALTKGGKIAILFYDSSKTGVLQIPVKIGRLEAVSLLKKIGFSEVEEASPIAYPWIPNGRRIKVKTCLVGYR